LFCSCCCCSCSCAAAAAAAAAAARASQIQDIDEISDALLIQGLWAAAEQVDEDEEGPAPNADAMMEELAPLQVCGLTQWSLFLERGMFGFACD
jgi:hypothetical protein